MIPFSTSTCSTQMTYTFTQNIILLYNYVIKNGKKKGLIPVTLALFDFGHINFYILISSYNLHIFTTFGFDSCKLQDKNQCLKDNKVERGYSPNIIQTYGFFLLHPPSYCHKKFISIPKQNPGLRFFFCYTP